MKIPNDKGFTLVELIVTLLISAIVLSIAGSILLSSFHLFSKDASDNEAKMIGDTVCQWVSDRLAYATGMQMIEEHDTTTGFRYDDSMRVKDGKIYFQTATQSEFNYYGDAFYLNTAINMKVSENLVDNKYHKLIVTIEVLKKGEVVYRTESAVNPININLPQYSGDITGIAEGETLANPRIVFAPVDTDPTGAGTGPT